MKLLEKFRRSCWRPWRGDAYMDAASNLQNFSLSELGLQAKFHHMVVPSSWSYSVGIIVRNLCCVGNLAVKPEPETWERLREILQTLQNAMFGNTVVRTLIWELYDLGILLNLLMPRLASKLLSWMDLDHSKPHTCHVKCCSCFGSKIATLW